MVDRRQVLKCLALSPFVSKALLQSESIISAGLESVKSSVYYPIFNIKYNSMIVHHVWLDSSKTFLEITLPPNAIGFTIHYSKHDHDLCIEVVDRDNKVIRRFVRRVEDYIMKVRYLGWSPGHDYIVRYGSNDDPEDYLKKGEIYEVYDEEVHSLYTRYWINGKKFNSVHFEIIKER